MPLTQSSNKNADWMLPVYSGFFCYSPLFSYHLDLSVASSIQSPVVWSEGKQKALNNEWRCIQSRKFSLFVLHPLFKALVRLVCKTIIAQHVRFVNSIYKDYNKNEQKRVWISFVLNPLYPQHIKSCVAPKRQWRLFLLTLTKMCDI